MMRKSQRLQVIVDLNENNEKKALEVLGKAQIKKQSLQTQLESLIVYRQEYKDKYQSITKIGVNISQLLEFRAFISKLDKAIEEQEQEISDIEKTVIHVRAAWERQHQKTKSLQKVYGAARKEEIKQENKKEQNEQDDRSTRIGKGGMRNA